MSLPGAGGKLPGGKVDLLGRFRGWFSGTFIGNLTGDVDGLVRLADGDMGAPMGLPVWQEFTPDWNGGSPDIGNGTLEGRYIEIGDLVIFTVNLEGGSTTNWGGSAWTFGLPVEAASGSMNDVGSAIMRNPSVDYGGAVERHSTTVCRVRATTGGEWESIGASSPWTWDSDSYLRFTLSYQKG